MLIGATSIFVSDDVVERHDADIKLRGIHHGVVWGSMGFGGFGHPSYADV